MNRDIVNGLINFSLVAIVFLVVVAILFNIFCKKFKFDKKNIELYGLLMNLDTPSLISIATLTINYLFLVWCTISFEGLNVIYVAFIMILTFMSDAVIDNFKRLPISILLMIGDCVAIEVIYLIYSYIIDGGFSFLLILLLLLIILFVFLYYTYNLFREINNIVIRNKYLKDKKYKV